MTVAGTLGIKIGRGPACLDKLGSIYLMFLLSSLWYVDLKLQAKCRDVNVILFV